MRFVRHARVRALRAALESARYMERASAWLVDRVRAAAGPEDASDLTAWRYARSRHYLADWHREFGLFDFEARAIDRFFPAPPAHLLVHAAGSGREVHALLGRGYRVTAAEPVAAFAAAAREDFGTRVRVVLAALESPVSDALAGPFAGILVGWSAYGHLLESDTRVRVLRSLREACPDGPILVSWRQTPVPGLRGTAQSVYEAVMPPERRNPGAIVTHFGLFHAVIDELQLGREAQAAGSRVALFGSYGDAGYPNAVLLPAARPQSEDSATKFSAPKA